jgi:hypothetical protein
MHTVQLKNKMGRVPSSVVMIDMEGQVVVAMVDIMDNGSYNGTAACRYQ